MKILPNTFTLCFISLFIIGCANNETVKNVPSSKASNSDFVYFQNTKGQPKSNVSTIINKGRKNNITSVDGKKLPSTGIFGKKKNIVVAPGLRKIGLSFKQGNRYANLNGLAMLQKGKTYTLHYITKGNNISYYLKDTSTQKKTNLILLKK